MRTILSLVVVFLSLSCFSQDQDAWVYFTDKQTDVYSLANPITFLTQKAIDRKNAHGVVIDERDVPVNEAYITQLKAQTGITVMAKSKWLNAVHVRGSEANINALSGLVFVSSIDFADKSLNTGKQAQQKQQSKFQETFTTFNYGNSANQIQMIKGDQLHLANYTGIGMTVAVLDAGFPNVNSMTSFQRLRDMGHILGTYDFVNRDPDVYTNTASNHGTMVLSTMSGYVDNQYVGTAPDADYYLFITEDARIVGGVENENPVEESYWVEAAERADSLGVDVINSSLGYGSFYNNTNYNYAASDFDGLTTYITRGANIAYEKGLLIVNSAGNEGNAGVNAPADSEYVFSIGAVDANGDYAYFSSVGSSIQPTIKPDVVAQGLASYVINENDVIGTANGTSFSSPIMAGGLVCLWQALPDKTNGEIMQLVRESASKYILPSYKLGYGIPDLQVALNTALSSNDVINKTDGIKLFPNPTSNRIYIKFPTNQSQLDVTVFDILGKQVLHTIINHTNHQLDLSRVSNGMYMAKIVSKDSIKSFKIIKQ
ncbi:peptidase S8 [Yeosuana aromativorans]|uniref:Peptidase S8 n=1 Tax=Yeosuana aromativorans TaxID=288019 RepID=A0A8J3BJ45_9FLAO|nr:S8 family serine peptidase [Yeosuana aromativorans]GGK24878.1 peptidase S8 [Yeosuana aromativorans]